MAAARRGPTGVGFCRFSFLGRNRKSRPAHGAGPDTRLSILRNTRRLTRVSRSQTLLPLRMAALIAAVLRSCIASAAPRSRRHHLTPADWATTIRTARARCTSLTILVLIPQALAGLSTRFGEVESISCGCVESKCGPPSSCSPSPSPLGQAFSEAQTCGRLLRWAHHLLRVCLALWPQRRLPQQQGTL